MRNKRSFLVAAATMSLLVAGCDVPWGEDPNLGTDDQSLGDVLSVRYRNTSADYQDGEPIGLTVAFDIVDQERYGLPASADLLGAGRVGFPSTTQLLSDYPSALAATDPEAGCFEPIRLEDEQGETLLTVDGFCGDETPILTILGDLATGEELGWAYATAAGPVLVGVDE